MRHIQSYDADPDGRTKPRVGQLGGFRERDETAHILLAEEGQRRVSSCRVDFGEETRRRTIWWRNEQEGQQGGFQGGDETTHQLMADSMVSLGLGTEKHKDGSRDNL